MSAPFNDTKGANQAALYSIHEGSKVRNIHGTNGKSRNVESRRTHIFQPVSRRTTKGRVENN